jgi:hypothetical protein
VGVAVPVAGLSSGAVGCSMDTQHDTAHASPHLLWSELACHDAVGTPYPIDWRETRGRALAVEFERVRAAVGQSITVTSAYRTPAHNQAVGGKPQSQHIEGRALDLACPHGVEWAAFRTAVLRALGDADSAVRYACLYPAQGFVHVDIRPTKTLVVETRFT